MRIDSTMRCNMCAVHVGWDAVKQDGKFHSGYGSFVKGLDHSLEMLCKRQKKVMRCTVAPIKIFQGALSSLPQVKNAWQCLQTRHLWQITTTSHSKSPKSGPLGSRLFEALWGCSCHQTNPTFSMSRFHALEFPCQGFNLPIKNETKKRQKQNTEAPSIHLASKSRSHRSHSICSIDLSHFLDLKSRNSTNRTNSWTTSFGSLHLQLHHLHHIHHLHPQQTPATWMHHSRPGPHFSWSWCSLWKACTSKLDTHSTHYWKI